MSLIELLVVLGIAIVLLSFTTTLFVGFHRETRALAEKLEVLDLEKLLISSLADGSTCRFILNNPTILTFDSTSLPQDLTPSLPLYANVVGAIPGPILAQVGSPVSGTSPSLIVNSIKLNITSGSGATYLASWEVGFDASQLVRPLRPISIGTTLRVDTSTPTAASILACGSGAQTWSDVLASRAANTDYTNDTNQNIVVSASTYSGITNTRCSISILVDGIKTGFNFINNCVGACKCSATSVVPPGSTYHVRTVMLPPATPTENLLNEWAELR